MFQFESLELLYWDCWERFRIPLDARVIVVTGPNGSGKTTLLDALRTLLAAKTSEKRDYKKYVRRPNKPHSWIIGVVGNKRDVRGRPPFFPITTKQVTLACHINKKGGDWQRSYYILPGALSLEEIMPRSESPTDVYFKPRGVKEYQVELEKAGLSHAMLTVLALEQGATDKLCEYPPKELLKLVYAAFGDKPTLENYEKAIQDQIEAEKELETLRGKVDRLDSQCTALTNRVNNYREYEALTSQRTRLETEVMAQARYVDLYDGVKGFSGNILGLKRDVVTLKERKNRLIIQEKGISGGEVELKRVLESKEGSLKEAQKGLIEENRRRSQIEAQMDEIKRLWEECEGIEPEPLEPLQAALDAAMRERFVIEEGVKDIDQRRKDLQEEKASLLERRLRLDRPATSFHQRLNASGIAHTFLYESVEVLDEKWRIALESILKGFRYVILLKDPSDRWRAWKMGEEDGYRHFIVGESGDAEIAQPEGLALSVVKLSKDVPGWVRRVLADIHLVEGIDDGKRLPEGTTFITAKGFIRERRGGRSIAVEGADFAFGELGRKKRLESMERQIAEIEAEKESLDKQLMAVNDRLSSLKDRLDCQERLQRYLSRKEEETGLFENHQTIVGIIVELEKRAEIISQEKRVLEDKRIEVVRQQTAVRW